MAGIDRSNRKEQVDSLVTDMLDSVVLKHFFDDHIKDAYNRGFKDGQHTPDNRNINTIHDEVINTILIWLNDNDMYDGNLFDLIDMCFAYND